MNRLYRLQEEVLRVIDDNKHVDRSRGSSLSWERMHMASCAKVGYMLALDRGMDPILSACACAVHDFGRILTGVQEGHAKAGAGPVRTFLLETGLFQGDEVDQLVAAVEHHSNKGQVGTPLEELVKDADLIDYHSYGFAFPRQEQRDRFASLASALGLDLPEEK